MCETFSSDFIILFRALPSVLFKNMHNIHIQEIIIFTNALNSVKGEMYMRIIL